MTRITPERITELRTFCGQAGYDWPEGHDGAHLCSICHALVTGEGLDDSPGLCSDCAFGLLEEIARRVPELLNALEAAYADADEGRRLGTVVAIDPPCMCKPGRVCASADFLGWLEKSQ